MQLPRGNPSLGEILQDYRKHKLAEELRGDWGTVVFYRPPAMLLTWLFAKASIRPNHVTLGNALFLPLMVVVAFVFDSGAALITVCLLAIAFGILDCVDGSLARTLGMQSLEGRYLDSVIDIAARVCLYSSLGHISDVGEGATDALAPLQLNWLAVSLIAAWIATFSRLCRIYRQLIRAHSKQSTIAHGRLSGLILSAFSGIDHALPFIALLCWLLNLLPQLILWLVCYSLLDLVYTQYTIIRSLRS